MTFNAFHTKWNKQIREQILYLSTHISYFKYSKSRDREWNGCQGLGKDKWGVTDQGPESTSESQYNVTQLGRFRRLGGHLILKCKEGVPWLRQWVLAHAFPNDNDILWRFTRPWIHRSVDNSCHPGEADLQLLTPPSSPLRGSGMVIS